MNRELAAAADSEEQFSGVPLFFAVGELGADIDAELPRQRILSPCPRERLQSQADKSRTPLQKLANEKSYKDAQ